MTGPASIIEAVAAGQRAAASIDHFFRGEKLTWRFKSVRPKQMVKEIELTDEEMETLKRQKMPCLKAAERTNNFKEVELGYSEEECVDESKRCLRCDL